MLRAHTTGSGRLRNHMGCRWRRAHRSATSCGRCILGDEQYLLPSCLVEWTTNVRQHCSCQCVAQSGGTCGRPHPNSRLRTRSCVLAWSAPSHVGGVSVVSFGEASLCVRLRALVSYDRRCTSSVFVFRDLPIMDFGLSASNPSCLLGFPHMPLVVSPSMGCTCAMRGV